MPRTFSRRLVLSAVAALVAAAGLPPVFAAPPEAYQRPGRTEIVSLSSAGKQSNDAAGRSGVSADGRFVAFESTANNLVPGDTNAALDVFVRDRRTGRTTRVNVASDGAQAVAPAPLSVIAGTHPSISADGRYVSFTSSAVNLVPGDTNAATDVFVHDVTTRKTVRATVASNGDQANDGSSFESMISADGRHVTFMSFASNLVPGDTNRMPDVFVHDLKTRKTVRASVSATGAQADDTSRDPSISANGRFVAFTSFATNLIPGATDWAGIVVRDMKTGKLVQAAIASDGEQPMYIRHSKCLFRLPGLPLPPGVPDPPLIDFIRNQTTRQLCATYPGIRAISDDGRFVVFLSDAHNLVPNDTNYQANNFNSGMDVFVRDLVAGRTERVSVDSYGHDRDHVSAFRPTMSSNGRIVSYMDQQRGGGCGAPVGPECIAACVIAVALCGVSQNDVFAYDRVAGAMEQVSVSATGGQPAPGHCGVQDHITGVQQRQAFFPSVNRDGRYVTFHSTSPNLVAGDTNKLCDLFLRDRGPLAGTGGFEGSSAGAPGPAPICVTDDVCLPPGALRLPSATSGARLKQGADLIGARVAYRPATRDLFVRWDVAHMPTVAGVPVGGPLYSLALTAGGVRYEVRAQRVPGADFDAQGGASFGLFRQDASTGLFIKVATLKGGYGTTGPSVVVAVPLSDLAVADDTGIREVRAFSATGAYATGATRLLDTIALTRVKTMQS